MFLKETKKNNKAKFPVKTGISPKGICRTCKKEISKENPKIHMLDKDYTREDFFKKFPNAKTFPQIIINGESIGGYHELEKWLSMNSFNENFCLPQTCKISEKFLNHTDSDLSNSSNFLIKVHLQNSE